MYLSKSLSVGTVLITIMEPHIREAYATEEELCSRVLANAFLPIWNHNWFQGTCSPIAKLPYVYDVHTKQPALSSKQEQRRKFYHALIRFVRLGGGSLNVMTLDQDIVAIVLWSAPYKHPSFYHIISSGFLRLALIDYGLRAFWKIQFIFEYNIAQIMKDAQVVVERCGYVQMLAVNPDHQGHGYGAKLLSHMLCRHVEQSADSPGVLLDCTTTKAEKMYAKQGFQVIGERAVDSDTDVDGITIPRSHPDYQEKRNRAKPYHIQKVMLWKP
ncbi:protein of unknown function [Taphrina deformans PYCC 5710]|uniref:N-acetyltransferase domain-containing protein n=1 Tax=Taphrina deformans (strain PYCC 5710 / ATCC 11124 / CBS 356.35 / IMI 108563 / JCM 9778 / NBRC 8474) TaxID=1097556 RepID=R4XJY1_TAPDE|nr:protein of unknown function [Taphrina deformans PYCC 5710]|eukprot:CCG83633.1 protein of unknown function [Taphrina deformans PYCC 5710]